MTAFPSPRPITARWRSLDCGGLDHAVIAPEEGRIVVRGTILGARGGVAPYGVYYRLDLDEAWRTRELALGTADGRGLHLLSDGAGHWANGTGEHLPQFDGCHDVDLAGTPFTNTLPIRRRPWEDGMRSELKMVYVPFDTFEPVVDGQIYTCVEAGRRFFYEASDRSFSVELSIDGDGLVTDYPSLFERML